MADSSSTNAVSFSSARTTAHHASFLLSKFLELVRIEQEPVRVFVSVQFHRRFQFHKRGQLFICPDNEPLSIIKMRVSNEGCSSARIQG
jgi:hypothetical protein